MPSLPPSMQMALAALVLAAAVFDIRYRRIPNWLALSGLLAGFSLAFAFFRAPGLLAASLGAALAFAVYFPLFALRAMGAGDLKLMMAVAAFTGPSNWITLFVLTAILGGVLALGLILHRGQPGRTFRNVLAVAVDLLHFRAPYRQHPELDLAHPRAVSLPHGVSIAGGTLLFLMLDYLRM